jgi:hypothetical protein
MQLGKRFLCTLAATLCLSAFFVSHAIAAANGAAGEEVRVPISLEVPYAVAGAEFEISYTSGLTFLSFEKSEAIASAATTPVVEKNGSTYLGFYTANNDYVPVDGWLDVGYLIFLDSGEPGQSVTVTEAKYVQVIDKDTTDSEILTINEEIAVPLASADGLKIGKKVNPLWIAVGAEVVLVAGGAFVLVQNNRKLKAKLAAATNAAAANAAVSTGTGTDTNPKE